MPCARAANLGVRVGAHAARAFLAVLPCPTCRLGGAIPQQRGAHGGTHLFRRSIATSRDRDLTAFERATIPEEVYGPRVRELPDRLDALEARRDRLLRERRPAEPLRLDVGTTAAAERTLRAGLTDSTSAEPKRLIGALVHSIDVEGRHSARPTIRIPTVRTCGPHGGPWRTRIYPAKWHTAAPPLRTGACTTRTRPGTSDGIRGSLVGPPTGGLVVCRQKVSCRSVGGMVVAAGLWR